MVSTKVDLANQTLLTTRILEASDREVVRMASLSLPQTGTWLNCPLCQHLDFTQRHQVCCCRQVYVGNASSNSAEQRCELTQTPANQVQISFRNTNIEMYLMSSKIWFSIPWTQRHPLEKADKISWLQHLWIKYHIEINLSTSSIGSSRASQL